MDFVATTFRMAHAGKLIAPLRIRGGLPIANPFITHARRSYVADQMSLDIRPGHWSALLVNHATNHSDLPRHRRLGSNNQRDDFEKPDSQTHVHTARRLASAMIWQN